MKANLRISILFSIILLSSIELAFASKKQGTESGGGGGVVWATPEIPILMDFYTIVKSLEELPTLSTEASFIDEQMVESIMITSDNEGLVKSQNTAIAHALNTLEKWKKLPFDSISTLVLAMFRSTIEWNFTTKTLHAPPFYFAPYLPVNSPTEVAAYYVKNSSNNFSISISRRTWNQMQLLDQAGLLIHEILRQLQIGFGNNYNDESLQRATAIYSLCKPTTRLNFYITYLLNNTPLEADRIYGEFEQFIKIECKRL